MDYYALRTTDAEMRLLRATVEAFERALQLTEERHRGGVASAADVAQAETQLALTRAQAIDLEVARAQEEHAIAVLVGGRRGLRGGGGGDGAPLAARRARRRWDCRRSCSSGGRTSRRRSGACRPPTRASAWRGRPTSRASP